MKNLNMIVHDIYVELFRAATPSADFNDMEETGETSQENFFMKYYLGMEDQMKIIERICNENKLGDYEIKKVKEEVDLGCSPTWIERNKHGA